MMLRMMLCMMLCVTVPLAHDAVQPLSPNLSCPFLLSTSVVHISACSFGCARRLAVLVAEVYLAHCLCACKLRCSSWSCESALRTQPLRENTYDFAAGAGAAAGKKIAYNFGRSHGNASRATLHLKVAILQPELSESSSRTFLLKTCEFSAEAMRERTSRATFSRASGNALHVLLYLKLAICQPELRERASHTTFFVLAICECRAGAAEAHCAY